MGLIAFVVDETDFMAEESGVEEREIHVAEGFDMIFGIDEVSESICGQFSILTQTDFPLTQ